MRIVNKLIENNKAWADKMNRETPGFFDSLARQQHPEILWIGCADSRVSANVIAGLQPGEVFVHRNVANMVVSTDFNVLSVIQYAVEYLNVKSIIVCGHYNCGGIIAAYQGKELGLIDNWVHNIRDVYFKHHDEIHAIEDEEDRLKRLSELNVKEQVHQVCHTTIVQNAWKQGKDLTVSGLVYSVENGILKDLGIHINNAKDLPETYTVK